jgi:type IV pilus assembly protein PilF
MRREHAGLLPAALALAFGLAGCAAAPSRQPLDGAGQRTSAVGQRAINTAQYLADQGKFEEALEASAEALRLEPRSAQAHAVHASILEVLGREDEAGASLERAVALAPASGPVLNAYGAWLCRNARVDEALATFSKALLDESYRRPEQALANAGGCAAQVGRDEMAELNFRAALGLDPRHAPSLVGMAMLEQRKGRFLQARAFLQRREALGPLAASELGLGIDIETAAGDAAAAERYRSRLLALGQGEQAASPSPSNGSSTQ